MEYMTIAELITLAEENKTTISEIVLRVEIEDSGLTREELRQEMEQNLEVMKEAVNQGRTGEIKSASRLTGGDAARLLNDKSPLAAGLFRQVMINALAVSEVNAGMGKVVAGPTAGSSGIIPAVILAVGQEYGLNNDRLVDGLFTAAGLGTVVALKATLAGAAGGCQAECGVASAMAAGAVIELCQGRPAEVGDAFALALKNLLGLVCDPVAGLVEVPCVKRNGFAATHALTAASMALAGIKSVIPADEVIDAMAQIGTMMPTCLKETAQGGLAVTNTGLKLSKILNRY